MVKINVCHIASGDLWGGAEAQIDTLLEGLCRCGALEIYALLLNEGELADRLRRYPMTTVVVDERKHSFPAILRYALRFLREKRIDLIHTHRYKENLIGGLGGVFLNIPVVRTQHGSGDQFSGYQAWKMKIYTWIDTLVGKYLTRKIIAVSQEMKTILQGKYGREAIFLIRNGVRVLPGREQQRIRQLRRSLGIGDDHLVVGTAGRLVPVKGLDCFIRAAKLVYEAMPRTRFVILGDGPLMNPLQSLARELGLAATLRFPGHREDAALFMAMMDIYVTSSLHEGLPMAVLEAQSLGRAVVATAVGGLPEIVQDGITGRLVSPGDVQGLAGDILELLSQEGLREALGQRGRENIWREFTQARLCQETVQLYQSLFPPVGQGPEGFTPEGR